MKSLIQPSTLLVTLLLAPAVAHTLLIEAESFDDLGGWVIDTQSIDQMGSPYLLAHGLGRPVEDATTTVELPLAGTWHIFVRTRDWVAPWNAPGAPGRFQLLLDRKPLPNTLGTERPDWHWQYAGPVTITEKRITLALHDLTGFDGRADAVVLTTDPNFHPPDDQKALQQFRRNLLGLSDQPQNVGPFDFVVVGGGMAGTCAAVGAARLGLNVALIQNRPVLGGNNSSEVRVHLNGRINLPPYPALGNLVKELDSGKRGNAQPADHYDDTRKIRIALAEPNLKLFLNTHAFAVEKTGNRITAVLALDVRTGAVLRFAAPLFADCTGDGNLGYLAAADYRIGRESKAQTAEPLAPEKPDNLTMGASVQWYSVETDRPSPFPECPWALQFNEQSCYYLTRGDWNWETGFGRDPIADAEYIRDYALRAVFGNWAYLKNHSRKKVDYANRKLAWVAYIAGKRESRRLLGDIILRQQDIVDRIIYDDAFVPTTWSIDLHYPDPQNAKYFPDEPFRSIARFLHIQPYPIPYRCLYSRNIDNLFMAGRCISVTHVALGTVRVMRTGAMTGELVAMAAALCKKHQTNPRNIYKQHLKELKSLARIGLATSDLPDASRRRADHQALLQQARRNADAANEALRRCHKYLTAWLAHADPVTSLIPRNLRQHKDLWYPQDSAADNYPFMVLTAALTDRPMFETRMLQILQTEKRLTSRLGPLPDAYSFSKRSFLHDKPDLARIIFGASEYVKDGLMPLTEYLGPSPWADRMLELVDAIWQHAPVQTPYGNIPSTSHEVNGEMLQCLARLYWMTGQQKYLDWAIRLGDYYLLTDRHPTRSAARLRLRDHGCEIVSGLCELYATVHFARPEKKHAYHKPIHQMLDRILQVGTNDHGMLYNWIDPTTGRHDSALADTWGYNLNGFYTVYLIDKTESYRQAALKALQNLYDHYRNYPWEGSSADGYADSIESALNLYNRLPVPSAARWIDSETRRMWAIQKPDGIIEGWHGDGNFARTSIMYSLWKTQGLTAQPWRNDLRLGAVYAHDSLYVVLNTEKPWKGKLLFDTPRHKTNLHLPLDWPRINQFPEWFTVQPGRIYRLENLTAATQKTCTAEQLAQGIDLTIPAAGELVLRIF